MNLKNAKEVKEKVEEVKSKRMPAKAEVKKVKNVKKTKKVKKTSVLTTIKRWLKLFALWILECLVCGTIVVMFWCLNTMEGYTQLFDVVQEQQDLIEDLVNEVTEIRVQPEAVKTVEKKMAYNLTAGERELLAQLLYHEARGESLECQKAVASVILNRVDSKIWGDSLTDVIYAKNQFEPVVKGLLPNTKPLQKQYEAIDYVLENGATVPEEVLYFRADHYFEWATDFMNMDNTYFSF